MNILPIKHAGKSDEKQHYKYQISAEDLLQVFKKNNWIDHNVDLVNHDENEVNEEDYEYGIDKSDKSVRGTLDEQIAHYKKLVRDLEIQRLKEIDNNFAKQKKPVAQPQKSGFDKYFEQPVKETNLMNDENALSNIF